MAKPFATQVAESRARSVIREVHYCCPSSSGPYTYASGSRRFDNDTDFRQWLEEQLGGGWPVLITSIRIIASLKVR